MLRPNSIIRLGFLRSFGSLSSEELRHNLVAGSASMAADDCGRILAIRRLLTSQEDDRNL